MHQVSSESVYRVTFQKWKPQFSANVDIWEAKAPVLSQPPFTDEGQIWYVRVDP